MLQRKKIDNHDDWIAERSNGIGGSEAAAIVGMSPWMSAVDLWKIKTGQKKPPDLSDNALVQQGHDLEPHLRNLFMAMHPELLLKYHEFDLVFQSERPWLYATLDGELEEIDSGRKGILEIKTATPNGKAGWSKWDQRIPDAYAVQTRHQLLAIGYDFVYLFAALFGSDGNINVRTYYYERTDVEDDLNWLLSEEEKFWSHVQNRTMPPMKLVL